MLRALKLIAALLVGLLVLPYLLTPLYLLGRPISTLMLMRWATGARVERLWVPLAAMAASLPASVIAAEDARFRRHRGIDLAQIREAIEDADTLGEVRGASTLSQQTAKNLFLWPGRSFLRKLLEAPLALWLHRVLGKRTAPRNHLTLQNGARRRIRREAAARRAFGKGARNVNPREARCSPQPSPTRVGAVPAAPARHCAG